MNKTDLLKKLPKPFFVLAPMDDVTDTVFRQIIATLPYDDVRGPTSHRGPDLFITEFVNVDGLQSPGRPKLLKKLQFTDKERPIFAQLWGLKPENFYKTAKEIVTMGFDGIDINMGCPVKTVIKNGACAALINNRQLAGEIIDATRAGAGADFPISVKTRVGFSTTDMSWLEFLLKQKLDLLSIHGRTAKQLSKVPADWELIGQVREMHDAMFPASATPFAKASEVEKASAGRPATLIVGNGDVMTRQQGLDLAKKYKLDGIMIGRGVFHDPFVFAHPLDGGSPWEQWTKQQKINLFRRHIELFMQTWRHDEYKFETLKKFAKVYISDFDGASELRERVMKTTDPKEAITLLSK